MAALISVLIAVTLSLLITRVAAEVLVLTGLSHQAAYFQAQGDRAHQKACIVQQQIEQEQDRQDYLSQRHDRQRSRK